VRPVVAAQPSIIYVQFVLADKGAKSVTVAGDFNDWNVDSTPLVDTDGDGVWTGLVALRPGQHKYMFVIDGQKWVTDPEAERYIDDGFGMRNAVVTVTPPSGRTI
jgi:1,4-alpha-glucan branching enzyme